MASKYHFYERFFFRLQMKEGLFFRTVFLLLFLLVIIQLLLTHNWFRKYTVLTEKYEGEPVKFYNPLK